MHAQEHHDMARAGVRLNPLRLVRQRAAGLLTIGALALLIAGGCCSPDSYQSQVDATKIVCRNSVDAFEAFFDATQDAAAFGAFNAQAQAARDRAQLASAWQTVPSLAAKGGDFLEQKVFTPAMSEKKWPKDTPAEALEPAFVQGVREGVRTFLNER